MKKLILLALTAALFSCSTQLNYLRTEPETVNYSFLDFSKYAQKGFYFSPRDITTNYRVLGEISITLQNKTVVYFDRVAFERMNRDGYQADSLAYMSFDYVNKPITSLFDKAYEVCVKKGGNGLLFYKIESALGSQSITGTLIKTE